MNGWDRAKELTLKNAGGIFFRLQNDGEKAVVVFRGVPFATEVHWTGGKYVDCDGAACEHCKDGSGLSTRVKLNVFLVAERAMKIFECSGKTFHDILEVRDKYGVDAWSFQIKRSGAAGSTKTKYSVLPEKQLTADEQAHINALPLHNLEAAHDDEEEATSPATSARRPDPNAPIAPAVVTEFRSRLRQLPKEKAYYPILGAFGCERLDEIRAADEAMARSLIERAERGEAIAPPPPPANELDEFA